MSLSSTSLPKPKNWQDFETKTRVLFSCILGDPNAQQNGRTGQPQHGVDVYGYRYRDTSQLVGIQCKKKYEAAVSEAELRKEVNKAKKFKPAISEFVLVTTAPRDQKIQEVARTITAELKGTNTPFSVFVWGWEDIEENAAQHTDAWKAFDPTWTPFVEQGFERISVEMEALQKSVDSLASTVHAQHLSPAEVQIDPNAEDTPLHGKITAYQQMINDGHASAAFAQLSKLKSEEWAAASRSERYRTLTAMASAKLKLGHQEEAGQLLFDAYGECPEHKNAKKNRATGYLLIDRHDEAAALCREVLDDNQDDAEVAGTLIQALIEDNTVDDPLTAIPAGLNEKEPVLVARVHFARCRNQSEWKTLAKDASVQHKENKTLKLFAAEAVLNTVIEQDRDAIAGGDFKASNIAAFQGAADTLYQAARDAIDKGYALSPPLAHNAALALRFLDDTEKAKEVLDAAIEQNTDDQNLRLQRAIIAYVENDPDKALALLPEKPEDPEAFGIVAEALVSKERHDDAIALVEQPPPGDIPHHVNTGLLEVRVRSYIARGEDDLAISLINRAIGEAEEDTSLRVSLIHVYLQLGDRDSAISALDDALACVDDDTNLVSRIELSLIAQKLRRFEVTVGLLDGRIAFDRESEGLHLLIAASINAGHLVTARTILDGVAEPLKQTEWHAQAEAILAIKTGDPTTDSKIARYLQFRPQDLELRLVRLSIWQGEGREQDIRNHLGPLNPSGLQGSPEHHIRLAALLCHYGYPERGLAHAYAVIMDNWDKPSAHLAYQSLIFLNQDIDKAFPPSETVNVGTVVGVRSNGNEHRYRIETAKFEFFSDERLSPDDDLAQLLLGKSAGDKVELKQQFSSAEIQILWIKPTYLDAFHLSVENFNERFPRADGLQKFKFDGDSTDPLVDMRAVTKARAEADQHIIEQYRTKSLPLSFAAALIGKNPIDAWAGLPELEVEFQVCRGNRPEREQALLAIQNHGAKGCVLDAITLSVVRRLGIEEAVAAVCGPIHTTQSVADLFAIRAFEAQQNKGKKQGFLAWRDEQLVYQEYSQEQLQEAADERQKESEWVKATVRIVSSMPKQNFSPETRNIMNMVGHTVCDPAVAADGSDLLLVSEDMGYRIWGAAGFGIQSTWLQPVLIIARDQNLISSDDYAEAITLLALSNHAYISLDPACLLHQARKDGFAVTRDMSRLIRILGGPAADLLSNIDVVRIFIDALWAECNDDLKIKRMASETFTSIIRGRSEKHSNILAHFLKQVRNSKGQMRQHIVNWLVGHSIGMPDFQALLEAQER